MSTMQSDFICEHEFIGIEYDWLAIDKDGYMGYFSTAGVAPIPEICTSMPTLFDDIFEKTISMTTVCTAAQVNGFDKNVSDWMSIGAKGLYAFDWCRKLSKYQLIAKPQKPRHLESLDEEFENLARKIELCCNYSKGVGLEDLILFK